MRVPDDEDCVVTLFIYLPSWSDRRDVQSNACSGRLGQTPVACPAYALAEKCARTHHLGKRWAASNPTGPVLLAQQLFLMTLVPAWLAGSRAQIAAPCHCRETHVPTQRLGYVQPRPGRRFLSRPLTLRLPGYAIKPRLC